MRISDWSSDVFSSDLPDIIAYPTTRHGWGRLTRMLTIGNRRTIKGDCVMKLENLLIHYKDMVLIAMAAAKDECTLRRLKKVAPDSLWLGATMPRGGSDRRHLAGLRSEDHPSDLQSLMRHSYAVF